MKHCTINTFLFAFSLNANASLSIDDFLRQAQDDAKNQMPSSALASPHSGNSWIENAELRYSDDNDRANKRATALRLEPKWFDQKSAEDTILSLRQKQHSIMFSSALNKALKLRYEQLLELLAEQSLVHKIEQLIAINKDEGKLQHHLVFTDGFRPNDLLQSELSADQLSNQVRSHRKRLLDLRKHLGIDHPPSEIVTIDDMLAVTTTAPKLSHNNELQAAKLKLELAQQQRKLIRAKQGAALNLLEIKHERADRKDDILGITLGIRIPFGSNYSNSQREHDVTDAMYELQLQYSSQQRNAAAEKDMLHWQKTQADITKAILKDIEKRIQPAMQSGNPGLLLALKKRQLKENGRLIDIRHRALRHYFNYLSLTGQLAKAPLRNWLIPGQPALQPEY